MTEIYKHNHCSDYSFSLVIIKPAFLINLGAQQGCHWWLLFAKLANLIGPWRPKVNIGDVVNFCRFSAYVATKLCILYSGCPKRIDTFLMFFVV